MHNPEIFKFQSSPIYVACRHKSSEMITKLCEHSKSISLLSLARLATIPTSHRHVLLAVARRYTRLCSNIKWHVPRRHDEAHGAWWIRKIIELLFSQFNALVVLFGKKICYVEIKKRTYKCLILIVSSHFKEILWILSKQLWQTCWFACHRNFQQMIQRDFT